ncbi:MAG TPA: HAD-IC family P-type ATPase [Nitrolancea sp.]|nr:HAD-IC family P-type ATPase [Nitrolancea sp.]
MVAVAAEAPRVLHALPGRTRIQLSGWMAQNGQVVVSRLRSIPGVRRTQLNPVTGNVLVQFDPAETNQRSILNEIDALREEGPPPTQPSPAPAPVSQHAVFHERAEGHRRRARVPIRGLEFRPGLGREIERKLRAFPGVSARASELTGRVLIEYDAHHLDLEDLIASLANLDIPDLPDVDDPAYPMDPAPLIHGAARTAGATLGIMILLARRLVGQQQGPIVETGAATFADTLNILRGIPFIRYGFRRLVGRDAADLTFSGAGILSLTLSGNLQGLILNGVEGFRLVTEVLPRREAWRRFTAAEEDAAGIHPGASFRPEPGERVPYPAMVISGTGTAIDAAANLIELRPEVQIPPGATIHGGPVTVQLHAAPAFDPLPRAGPLRPTLLERYLRYEVPASLGISAATGIVTRSFAAAFNMLVQASARTALTGSEAADLGTAARVLRSGAIIVGTRPDRTIRTPDTLVLDGARPLVNGFDLSGTFPLTNEFGIDQIQAIASRISTVVGAPWGRVFPGAALGTEDTGSFNGRRAIVQLDGEYWTLGSADLETPSAIIQRVRERGDLILILAQGDGEQRNVALLTLRPRLANGVEELVALCMRDKIELVVCCEGDVTTAREVARRAGISLLESTTAIDLIQQRQRQGDYVAIASDHIGSAPAFSAADLAIAIIERQPRFPARADLLAPDLRGVVDILEAGRRRDRAMRDSVLLSIVSNVAGVTLAARSAASFSKSANVIYLTAMTAIGAGWLRLRGGERTLTNTVQLREPRPERWGRLSIEQVLEATHSREDGLTSEEARKRLQPPPMRTSSNPLALAVLEQLRSPLVGIMAAGALLSLSFGAAADVVIIGATIVTNVAIGVWQERRAERASTALAQLTAPQCEVVRDGKIVKIPGANLVPGDVILLSAGGRVAADARIIDSDNLEVNEAALTGESLPVSKQVDGSHDQGRIVLEGSDVISGRGRAVVVATGRDTKMGTLAAAIERRPDTENPLNARLMRMLNLTLPIAGTAGIIVTLSGILRQRSLTAPLALGSSVAIAAVPEGMPLLARMGEAAVGQRLAGRRAVVRRLSAIEALGRVDVAGVDKTGTLTTGQLEVTVVDDLARQATFPGPLSDRGLDILRTAALASPPPDDATLSAHATDDSVVRAAILAGINGEIQAKRQEDFPFGSERSYHASRINDRVYFKGAPEVLLPLCSGMRRNGSEMPIDEDSRRELLERAQELAGRGLRVLAVARGANNVSLSEPDQLVALGFIGIADPLREGVQQAVDRCHQAGVRVVMLTGDHPETARTIGREAGLRVDDHGVLIGSELSMMEDAELDRRMRTTTVVARATPIDKLRIIESLRRLGHTVAMTGDGVNDAPALRLADVGVAMGRGTEVAREAADIVLLNEDFATLVEALVEGRGFWHNIRRAVSLLLGGNLGELGLITGVSLLGLGAPLNTRQILAVNMITDVLPALAIALQPPRQRNLSRLSREGASSLEQPLRREIVRRGLATAGPSLAAYVLAARAGMAGDAASVAFSSIVATQFAQTLQAGWSEGGLSKPVIGAIGVSTGLLVAALTVMPLRTFLGLLPLSPFGAMLVALAALASVALSCVHWPDAKQRTVSVAVPTPQPA